MNAPLDDCPFPDRCPSDDELCGVLIGSLSGDRSETVLTCCETCVHCGERLEQLNDVRKESLADQHEATVDAFAVEDGCQRLQRQLEAVEDTRLMRLGDTSRINAIARISSGLPDAVRDKVFGQYLLLDEVARGGMGVVYRATQLNADRIVALKVVRSTDPGRQALERFQVEARAAAQLDHPHIVPVYDVGEIDGSPYFTMKLIEGESLAHRLDEAPLTNRATAALMRQVADAIQYSHERKILHRDIKPGNILLDANGLAHVTDFGLAKAIDSGPELTGEGNAVGTPAYMSPEQAAGKMSLVDGRSDVYALGAVLYCCLTGRPPFRAASAAATIMQVISEEPVPPRQLNGEIDIDLETITLKCLEKDPSQRYPSAREVAAELQRYLNGEPIHARPAGRLERLWKWTRRHPAKATATLTSCCLLLAIGMLAAGLRYSGRLSESLDATQQAKLVIEQREEQTAAALAEAVTANQRADREAYFRTVALAKAGIDDGDFRSAWKYVEQLPRENTPWETNYLRRMVHDQYRKDIPSEGASGTWSMAVNQAGDEAVFVRSDAAGTLVFFDPLTGAVRRQVARDTLHTHAVFNGDLSRMLAVSVVENAVHNCELWDATRGKRLSPIALEGQTEQSEVVGNRQLTWAVMSSSGVITMQIGGVTAIDVPSGRSLLLPDTNEWVVVDAAFPSSDDVAILVLNDLARSRCELRRYSLPGWELLQRHSPKFCISAVVLAEQSNELIVAATNQRVHRLNGDTLEVLGSTDALGYEINDLDVSRDETRIAVAGLTGMVEELDRQTMSREARHFGAHYQVLQVKYARDSMLWSCGLDGRVIGWPVGRDSEKQVVDAGAPVSRLAFSSDSAQLAVAVDDSTGVQMFDVPTGRLVRSCDSPKSPEGAHAGHDAGVTYVAFCDQDNKLVTIGWDRTLCLWDAATGELIQRLESTHTDGIHSGAISPDRRYAFSACLDGTVGVWDLRERKFQRRLEGKSPLYACGISPDGQTLVAGGQNYVHNTMVCDFSKGMEHATVDDSQNVAPLHGAFFSFAFSPDGQHLAIGDVFNRISVVRSGTWELVWQQLSNLDSVAHISFSPDGTRVISCSGGGRVILWDAETGQEILRLKGHRGAVRAVEFSPDGKTIATGGEDGKIMLWQSE